MATQDGLCHARTALSLATAMMFVTVPMQPLLAIGPYIHMNREMLVDQALETKCSHLLFVDSDMQFGHDAIVRLLNDNRDIIGARYNKKMIPAVSTVLGDFTQITDVPFLPTGFLLINCEVFKKIGKPYFSHQDAESEDVYFCDKAKRNDYKLYCDPTIQIGHLGTAVF